MGIRVQRSVSRPLRFRLLFWDFGALGFGTLVWGLAAELVGALQGCGGRGGSGFMIGCRFARFEGLERPLSFSTCMPQEFKPPA